MLDDVADIANCKNYYRGTSPAVSAPDFLTRARRADFEFDTIAGNLDVSFNAKPQRQRCYHSLVDARLSTKTFLISIRVERVFELPLSARTRRCTVNIPTSLSINMDIRKKCAEIYNTKILKKNFNP